MTTPRWPSARGRGRGDGRRTDPHQVEGADQVDVDDFAVGAEVVRRPVTVHGALRPADAGAVDDDAQRRAAARGGVHRGLHRGLVGDVGGYERPADLGG